MKIKNVLALSALLALSGCGDNETPADNGTTGAVTSAPEVTVASVSGEALYGTHCARCHNPGTDGVYPGTQQLALTRGEGQAVLLQRDDITPGYVRQVVRHGIGAMATFRPSEISDLELDALAAYVASGVVE